MPAIVAAATAAAVQQREGLECGECLQRLLPGGHVEVRAATQTQRVGGSVGVEHERCRIPEGVMTRNRMRRVAARALAETPPTPPSPSLVLPCSIRVEEVQQAALLQKPAAADYAKQRRRVPVLQH